jgi:biotin-(acetyl-CoA carboxylase) ligase
LRALLPELLRYDALRGRRVRIDATSGVARGIDASGALLVETAASTLTSVVSGTVELLPDTSA